MGERSISVDHRQKIAEANRRRIWSEESRKKLSNSLTGRKYTKKARENMSNGQKGNKNALGHKHTDESKKKMSETRIKNGLSVGDKNPSKRIEVRIKISNAKTGVPRYNMMGANSPSFIAERHTFSDENQGKHFCKYCGNPINIKIWHYTSGIPDYCSKECRGKDAVGDKNSNWKGGISSEPYCFKFSYRVKEEVRERYNRKCIICGKSEIENGEKLCVHHVDYNKKQGCDDYEWKLVPLCRICHSKTNSNREYWEQYLTDVVT